MEFNIYTPLDTGTHTSALISITIGIGPIVLCHKARGCLILKCFILSHEKDPYTLEDGNREYLVYTHFLNIISSICLPLEAGHISLITKLQSQ